MKAEGSTIRVLLGCAVVLVVFGLVAALLLDTEDDDEAAGGATTTTEATTTTTSDDDEGSTSSSTASSSTSSSSTSTTRATTGTSATSTTRPSTTTTAGSGGTTTTAAPATTTTVPPGERSADLTLSRSPLSPPTFRFSIQNSGPHAASDVVLVISVGPGMTIASAQGREGMTCGAIEGATVRCTVAEAPVGGRVGGADLQVSGAGQVQASVQSSTADPDLRDNTVVAAA